MNPCIMVPTSLITTTFKKLTILRILFSVVSPSDTLLDICAQKSRSS